MPGDQRLERAAEAGRGAPRRASRRDGQTDTGTLGHGPFKLSSSFTERGWHRSATLRAPRSKSALAGRAETRRGCDRRGADGAAAEGQGPARGRGSGGRPVQAGCFARRGCGRAVGVGIWSESEVMGVRGLGRGWGRGLGLGVCSLSVGQGVRADRAPPRIIIIVIILIIIIIIIIMGLPLAERPGAQGGGICRLQTI